MATFVSEATLRASIRKLMVQSDLSFAFSTAAHAPKQLSVDRSSSGRLQPDPAWRVMHRSIPLVGLNIDSTTCSALLPSDSSLSPNNDSIDAANGLPHLHPSHITSARIWSSMLWTGISRHSQSVSWYAAQVLAAQVLTTKPHRWEILTYANLGSKEL